MPAIPRSISQASPGTSSSNIKNRIAQLRLLPAAPTKQIEEDEDIDREYECLDPCTERLIACKPRIDTGVYYKEEKRAMIENPQKAC